MRISDWISDVCSSDLETVESSLQLSEAVLVELGVAMGPVIASIHDKRDELRHIIKEAANLDREPSMRLARLAETSGKDLSEICVGAIGGFRATTPSIGPERGFGSFCRKRKPEGVG